MNLPAFIAWTAELQRRQDEHVTEVRRLGTRETTESGTAAVSRLDDRSVSDAGETEGGCALGHFLTIQDGSERSSSPAVAGDEGGILPGTW